MDERLFIHFIMCTAVSSLVLSAILIAKKGLEERISAVWQYRLDLLFLVALAIPLVPTAALNWVDLQFFPGNAPYRDAAASSGLEAITNGAVSSPDGFGWLQDFSLSAYRSETDYLIPLLAGIWLFGILAFAVAMFVHNRRLSLIDGSMKPIEDPRIVDLFAQCKESLGVRRAIRFGSSVLIDSPMTAGVFKPHVVLPAHALETLSLEGLRYVLLHELTHCKNNDIPLNGFICLLQAVYWFNPLVHCAFKRMRADRELACDLSVMSDLPHEGRMAYGKTLLHFVSRKPSPSTVLTLNTNMGDPARQIKKRIVAIASYAQETKRQKARSALTLLLASILTFSMVPIAAAFAAGSSDVYRFDGRNVTYEDLSPYFDGYEGSFVLYDLAQDHYRIFNREGSVTRISPDSTYKMYSALIALEEGALDAGSSLQPWDGTDYPFEAWNRDQDLGSAMQDSVSWYFQNLDTRLGIGTLTDYFTRLSYGNHDLSGGIDRYWAESSLRISPLEQVGLLKDVYIGEALFDPRHIETLKDILILSEKEGAVLSGKTGTGMVNGKHVNGWFVGYVERDGTAFLFAANIQGEDGAGGSTAAQIALSILEDKGIY